MHIADLYLDVHAPSHLLPLSCTQASSRVRALEGEIEQLKRTAGGHAKERLLKEKEVKKLQAQRDKKVGGSCRRREVGG